MIAVPAAARVSGSEDIVAEPVYCCIDDSHEVVFGDVFLKIHWQGKLVHGILNVQRNRSFGDGCWYFHFTKMRFLFVFHAQKKEGLSLRSVYDLLRQPLLY
ncbi:hypothetical protein SD71_05710 [Cohnella kolymensis]|uniref:Uncharacterized protein n=1 Tax=Cohnella kolymensis TaxID=1590652 RepID=A0ABR5A738_9BACL|nr:hypothetical protein SD71_05710 [Cohnella kolymensis]